MNHLSDYGSSVVMTVFALARKNQPDNMTFCQGSIKQQSRAAIPEVGKFSLE
jgi:hypothetical protein